MGKKQKSKRNKIDEKEFWVNEQSFKYKHPVLISIFKTILLILIIVFIIYCAISAETILSCDELKISKEDLTIKFENSTVYDIDGNYLATLSTGTKRKCITLEEMGEYLPNAYIAIEDERFFEHFGVDIKRTLAATVSYIIHFGKSDFGGSTITQQVVKNITHDKEDSANRKVKEMAKATQVEHYLDKRKILELYLNIIFIGGNDINGVELGAKYYFNKTAKELSIAECAFMAGINHAPNGYKPFKTDDEEMKQKIKKRTKTVLGKMKELQYITEEQYSQAISEVDNGLNFQNGDTQPTTTISYQTEAALEQIIKQIMEEKNVNKQMAEMILYSGGYKIYTTQKTSIQETVENELKDTKYLLTNGDQKSMSTVAIIDHSNGNVLACGTGIGEDKIKTNIGNLNYPKSLIKQTGSSMKPISVIVPGIENNIITGATVFWDGETFFPGTKPYHPKNYYQDGFKGALTMRESIAISSNIPHVKALSRIGLDTSIKFCQSVGIKRVGNEGLALALGGLQYGTNVIEMAGAYGSIANNGVYIEPTFYSKVVDDQDNVYIQCKPVEARSNRVMSEQTAYITRNILEGVVNSPTGTAKYCAIPGMSVAAKTGTTNYDYDRWLCGFTPYYTATCWFGYEKKATVVHSSNPAGLIWASIMKNIHNGLEAKSFTEPDGIVRATICKATGRVATSACSATYTEVFKAGTVPASCTGHRIARICNDSGALAGSTCVNVSTITYPNELDQEKNPLWVTKSYGTGNTPSNYCPIDHTPAQAPEQTSEPTQTPEQTPQTPAPEPSPTPEPTPEPVSTPEPATQPSTPEPAPQTPTPEPVPTQAPEPEQTPTPPATEQQAENQQPTT